MIKVPHELEFHSIFLKDTSNNFKEHKVVQFCIVFANKHLIKLFL